MANTYKNIVITPNRDTTPNVVPEIRFSGGDAATNTDINLRVYTTQSGTLSFEGSAGQLFSITNDLTNTIFSVNDVSGIPSLEIDANGLIKLAEFNGNVAIGRANANYKLDIVGTANASNLLANGNMVFTAANDGAGSNLDADLLDGQQGTYYGIATDVTAANRVANAAFLHANSGYAFANSIAITANLAFAHANSAYANGNIVIQTAQSAFTQANLAFIHANAAFASANAGQATGNAAFAKANAALANSTGTFAGSLTVSGDFITTGNVTLGDASTDTITLNGSIITLGNNQSFDSGTLFVDAVNNRVGIARTNPAYTFDVNGTGGFTEIRAVTGYIGSVITGFGTAVGTVSTDASGKDLYIQTRASGARIFLSNTNDNIGINTTNPQTKLDVNGTVNIASSLVVTQMNVVPTIQSAFATANSGQVTANQAFDKANTANITADRAWNHANAAFDAANTAGIEAEAAFLTANISYAHANAAFATANAALPKAGGTITGDLIVQGNATFSGLTTYANTQTLLIGDNILVLNADLPPASAPSENAGVTVNRGSSANVDLIWNEGTDKWTFNEGTGFKNIASNTDIESVTATAVAAFGVANTAGIEAEAAFLTANISYAHANAAFANANTVMISAQAAFTVANSGFLHANAAFATVNSAFATINVAFANANTVMISAQAAFTVANAAFLHANAAFDSSNADYAFSNSAHTIANLAFTHANAAFTTANAALPNTSGVSFAGNLNFPTGIVGIGTAAPTSNLHVAGSLFVVQNNSTSLAATGEIAEFAHNANSYTQIHVRNANTGQGASGDLVVTADTGSDVLDFIDIGINGSGYSQPTWTINGPRDGYLYTSHGNLAIGSANVLRSVAFFTGGTLAANERARFDPSGNLLIGRTNSTVGQSVKVDVNGAVNASAYLTGTGQAVLNNATTLIRTGYTVNTFNAGANVSAYGTWQPNPSNGNYQVATSNGAITITTPPANCAIDILFINASNRNPGSVTFTGYNVSATPGSTYAVTANQRYILSIREINNIATYSWYAMQ